MVRAERHPDECGDFVGQPVPVVDAVRGPYDCLGHGAPDNGAQPVATERAGGGSTRVAGVEVDEMSWPGQHQQPPRFREVPGERSVGLVDREPTGLEHRFSAILLDHGPTMRKQPDLQVGVAVAGQLGRYVTALP